MTGTKDSQEVINFMTLFQKLRNWIDDEPDALEELASNDKPIEELCNELSSAAFSLSMYERQHRRLFTSPADPNFIKAWRDYEARYESKISSVALFSLVGAFVSTDKQKQLKLDFDWKVADEAAREQASAIKTAIDFSKEYVLDNWPSHDDVSADLFDKVETGYRAWHDFFLSADYDLTGILRRRELVPFVLIPRHVSNVHGDGEKLSLFTLLQQAQEAFIFGVYFGALALMRAIIETAITEHYKSIGGDLAARIDACQFLPKGAPKAALHRLRRLANDILHFNKEDARLPEDIEKEILSLLYVVRAFIEGAPSRKSY